MIPTVYDSAIKAAAEQYLPGFDWRLYKAQLYQESALKPTARSEAGAQGLAQFMPPTWEEWSKRLGFPANASPFAPEYAIPAGAAYMAYLYGKWTAPRPAMDRYCLALASYNAGMRNLLKAQNVAGGANAYRAIIAGLPAVTGSHAKETTEYVRRIWRHYSQLVIG